MITPERGLFIARRYELVSRLATGGQGSVWAAHDHELGRAVAVKLMLASYLSSPEARARFSREAKAPAQLGSQYVVQVYDSGVDDDAPYIVMELLKGESLGERLARAGRLAQPDMAKILIQICKALRTAHEARMVHRDLKPSNIFLASKDDDVVVQVLDFGIAKATGIDEDETNTATDMVLGSPQYMSPEQIRSPRDVDHRADLWSLGVILYRALTGRLPIQSKEKGDLLVRICTDPIPAPSSIVPDLPLQMDRFFERALARDREHRFQSARELAEAFGALPGEGAAVPIVLTPLPALKSTLPMLPPTALPPTVSGEPGPEASRSNATTKKCPEPAPQQPSASSRPPPTVSSRPPPARAPHPSGADDPTFAVAPEGHTLQTEAALVSDRAADPVRRARPERGRGRLLWVVGAVTAAAAAAGLLAIVLQSRTEPPDPLPGALRLPPSAQEPSVETSSLPLAPPSASATASAAPRGSASARTGSASAGLVAVPLRSSRQDEGAGPPKRPRPPMP